MLAFILTKRHSMDMTIAQWREHQDRFRITGNRCATAMQEASGAADSKGIAYASFAFAICKLLEDVSCSTADYMENQERKHDELANTMAGKPATPAPKRGKNN